MLQKYIRKNLFKMSTTKVSSQFLATVMQQVKTPEKFLDAVFNYLNKYTTFYLEASKDNKWGFPAGLAKEMVDKYFTKHQNRKVELSPVLQDKIKEYKLQKLAEMTQKDFQAQPDSFNGAVREKYTWSQKYNDVTVKFHLPSHIKKAKQLRVEYDTQHLQIETQDEDPMKPMVKFIDAEFKYEINPYVEETTWWFEENVLYVSFKCFISN